MTSAAARRTRWWVNASLWLSTTALLAGAGLLGFVFEARPTDLVLIQLSFYGAWAALLGSWVGGRMGAQVEEDSCGELDMGVTSSMGAFVGAVSASLVAGALTGLALSGSWKAVWLGAVAVTGLLGGLQAAGIHVVRRPGFDARGVRVDAEGRPLADERQPARMRDRLTVAVTLSVLVMMGLVAFMAVRMKADLGHPVMIAPMMYGMTGGMIGGILGGWLAGLRDEHVGAPRHENQVMVGSMALMSGMMGAMPAAMVAGMLAVMGSTCIAVTAVSGTLLGLLSVALALAGRYALRPGPRPEAAAPHEARAAPLDASRLLRLRVSGMTCAACGGRVTARLLDLPGVRGVQVDVPAGEVALSWDDAFPGIDVVVATLEEIGYPLARG